MCPRHILADGGAVRRSLAMHVWCIARIPSLAPRRASLTEHAGKMPALSFAHHALYFVRCGSVDLCCSRKKTWQSRPSLVGHRLTQTWRRTRACNHPHEVPPTASPAPQQNALTEPAGEIPALNFAFCPACTVFCDGFSERIVSSPRGILEFLRQRRPRPSRAL